MPTLLSAGPVRIRRRVAHEAPPADVLLLLVNQEELQGRLGVTLRWDPDWHPEELSPALRPRSLANSTIAARAEAAAQVCSRMDIVLATEQGDLIGYWQDGDDDPLDGAALVKLTAAGRFEICAGRTLAETLLSEFSFGDRARFDELRDWFTEMGLRGLPALEADIAWPTIVPSPAQIHDALVDRVRRGGR